MELKGGFNAQNISFGILILFIIFLLVKMTDIALLLFVSYVISCAINPFVDKMSEKIPRSLATTVMIFVITLVTLLILTPIVIMSVNEIKEFLAQLPQQLHNIQHFLGTFKIGGQSISDYLDMNTVLTNSSPIAKEVIDKSINITIGFVGILTILVTIGIIVYFLTNDRDKIKEYCLKLFPVSIREKASTVMDELETKVGGYVTAQLLSITIVGIVVAVVLLVLKVEYAVFLGFISAILDLIPIVGPIVSGVLILLVAFPKGWIVVALAISSLLLGQFLENNWAKPYFFSKYMDLHPLVVIFSFIIAAQFLGVVGVLIAPAIAAVVVTLFEEVYIKTLNDSQEKGTNE